MNRYENKANAQLRGYAKKHGVYMWEIAHYLGMDNTTLSKRMRFELEEPFKTKCFKAVERLSKKA